MSTTYSIEFAKSGRAACKKCLAKIEKGALRVGTHVPRDDFTMSSWVHLDCFAVPRKIRQQGVTAEDFVRDLLLDGSEDGAILPARAGEVAAALERAGHAGGKKRASAGGGGELDASSGAPVWLEEIRKHSEASGDTRDVKPSAAKKAKDDMSVLAAAYEEYHDLPATKLKEMLQWNQQQVTATKPILLMRVLDGVLRGRLARCTLCGGGRLKLQDDAATVTCSGGFDEDQKVRLACQYKGTVETAPRWHPWYTHEPSPEEEETMKRMVAEAKGEAPPADTDSSVNTLVQKAEKLGGLELHNNEGIKKATAAIYNLIKSCDKPIDLPDDDGEARHRVGAMLAANRSLPIGDIVRTLVAELGFRGDKEDKAAKKQAALQEHCKCPENVPLVSAFQELSQLYFKEGNRNAGIVHSKVATTLQSLDFVVTPDNAMGLGKGKSKVPGIGESSAKKIFEFVSTGTMEKLEEKRATVT